MVALLLLALALSMDAFAVAIGLGAKHRHGTAKIAVMAGVYFGVFQGVMPLIGYLGGRSILGFIAHLAPWIACIILVGLGGKMLYEALSSDSEEDEVPHSDGLDVANSGVVVTHKTMTTLAIATSIDAMAAGFTLNLIPVNAWLSCLIIAVVTAVFSFFGVFLGKQSGTWLESKAEIFGGLVLIGIGLKMVLV
mgnify:FL=1|jgi:putative Mn2+ efflux pump MntP